MLNRFANAAVAACFCLGMAWSAPWSVALAATASQDALYKVVGPYPWVYPLADYIDAKVAGGSGLTLGTGVGAALALNIGSAGAPVLFNGAGGVPSSISLVNGTGLPIAGLTGLGTGVPAALAVAVGSAGGPVVLNGAAGTPSSISLANATALPAAQVPVTPTTAGTNVTLTGPRAYYFCSGTCSITLPAPVAGYEFCVRNADNVATVITLLGLGSSAMYEQTARTGYGTAGTGTAVAGGAVTDQICLLGKDSTHYATMSSTGTWTMN